MPREYFGSWNRTYGDWRNTETGSDQHAAVTELCRDGALTLRHLQQLRSLALGDVLADGSSIDQGGKRRAVMPAIYAPTTEATRSAIRWNAACGHVIDSLPTCNGPAYC